jgi:shikimate kinase
MDRKKEQCYLLVGPGGVGKSTIARLVADMVGGVFVDADTEFRKRFGEVGEYTAHYGRDAYYARQAEVVFELLSEWRVRRELWLCALPASNLAHSGHAEITKRNRARIVGKYPIVCVLASEDPELGAEICIQRQQNREYAVDESRVRRLYLFQEKIYRSIADLVVVNDRDVQLAAAEVAAFVRGHENEKRLRTRGS